LEVIYHVLKHNYTAEITCKQTMLAWTNNHFSSHKALPNRMNNAYN